jgi:hypothetical protein
MNTLLKRIDTTDLMQSDWAGFVATAKRMQAEVDEAWAAVEDAMRENGIDKMEGEWGRVSFVSRKNWKVDGKLAPRFYKQVVNTTKLNSMESLGEKLPEGVSYTTSYNFRKDLK